MKKQQRRMEKYQQTKPKWNRERGCRDKSRHVAPPFFGVALYNVVYTRIIKISTCIMDAISVRHLFEVVFACCYNFSFEYCGLWRCRCWAWLILHSHTQQLIWYTQTLSCAHIQLAIFSHTLAYLRNDLCKHKHFGDYTSCAMEFSTWQQATYDIDIFQMCQCLNWVLTTATASAFL